MIDTRVEDAIAALKRADSTGAADDFREALSLVRELHREATETPEERRRRELKRAADKAVAALGDTPAKRVAVSMSKRKAA